MAVLVALRSQSREPSFLTNRRAVEASYVGRWAWQLGLVGFMVSHGVGYLAVLGIDAVLISRNRDWPAPYLARPPDYFANVRLHGGRDHD